MGHRRCLSQLMNHNAQNPFFSLVKDQHVIVLPRLELECGDTLVDFPVAYKTWGKLNAKADNAMVVCHALSGSADVSDWWGSLLGAGRALDPTRFFIVCINSLGSPYGSASPVTINPQTGRLWGPEFPLTTIKDDVKVNKMVLDRLGVKSVASIIGGSMGGMLALEFAYLGPEYVRSVVLLATSSYHSAWGISWGEAQRQSIYADPNFQDGYYPFDHPPLAGLGAARMSALLTYRSRNSFESKFGRKPPNPSQHKGSDTPQVSKIPANEEAWAVNNHGLIRNKPVPYRPKPAGNYFTAQSYLRYQGDKFVHRYDANCYIAITRKLDTHDVSRGRASSIPEALAQLKQKILIIGIASDGLFTFAEQQYMDEHISHTELIEIESPDGHDAFLLEFAQINHYILNYFSEQLPDIMQGFERKPIGDAGNSMFGEADVTTW